MKQIYAQNNELREIYENEGRYEVREKCSGYLYASFDTLDEAFSYKKTEDEY